MAKKQKFDGVIVGVHFDLSGRVDWVRVFLRRGAIFSDRLILSRQELIEQIKQGKQFIIGERVEYLAGTFKGFQTVSIRHENGDDFLISSQDEAVEQTSMVDRLAGAPII